MRGMNTMGLHLAPRQVSGSFIGISGTSPAEDAPVGTVIGTPFVSNAPAGTTYAFAVIANPTGLVAFTGGQFETAASLDFETDNPIPVTIRATPSPAGDIIEQTVLISIVNVLEVTLGALSLSNTNVVENAPAGFPIATIEGTTVGGDVALIDDAQGRFALSGDGTQLLVGLTGFDRTAALTHDITLRETHPDAADRDTTLTVTIDPPIGAYATTVAARSGLLGYYRTADGADFLGSNNGTITGTVVSDPSGPAGSSMLFDGASYLTVPSAVVPSGTSARTILAWVKPQQKSIADAETDFNLVNQSVFSSGTDTATAASGDNFEVFLRAQTGYTFSLDTAGGASRSNEQIIPDGPGWQQVVIVVPAGASTTDCLYYVDGVDRTSPVNTTQALNTAATTGVIGAQLLSAGVHGRYFDGRIADVQIYGRALTAQEVADDYTAGMAEIVYPVAPDTQVLSANGFTNGTLPWVQAVAYSDETTHLAFRGRNTGSGTLSLVKTTGPQGRGGALRLASNGDLRHVYRPRHLPDFASSSGDRLSEQTGFGVAHAFEVVSGSGDIGVLRITSDGNNSVAYGLRYSTTTRELSVVRSSGSTVVLTSAPLDPGPVEAYLEVDAVTGDVTLETRQGSGSWTSQGTASPGAVINHFNVQLGGIASSAVTVDHFYMSYSSMLAPPEEAKEGIEAAFWGGSGCRSASQTEAQFTAIIPHRAWVNQQQVRVRFLSAPGVVTPWQDIRTDSPIPAQSMRVSGLTAGTTYTYVFEVSDGTNVVATSPVYTMQTKLPIGVDTPYVLDLGSCHWNVGQVGPYIPLGFALADGSPMMARHLGDQGYESENNTHAENIRAVETTQRFYQVWMEWATRSDQHRAMKASVYEMTPDDHQWLNEGTARCNPDGPDAEITVNGYPGSKNQHPVTSTTSLLWGMGLKVFDTLAPPHLHYEEGQTLGTNPYRYGADRWGNTWRISLEGRQEMIVPEFISADQLAWFYGQIDAFATSTAKLLIVECQGVLGPVGSVTGTNRDGWAGAGRAQYGAAMEYIRDNVPDSKSVILVGGDKHVGYNVNQVFEDSTNSLIAHAPDTALLAAVVSSGMATTKYYNTGGTLYRPDGSNASAAVQAEILDFYPGSGTPGDFTSLNVQEVLRTSMMRFNVDTGANTVQMRMWDNLGNVLLNRTLPLNVGVAAAPTFTSSPNITGTPTEGETLTVNFTAAGTPFPSIGIEWLNNGVVIAGQTASTLTLGSAQVGGNITARVTLTNASGTLIETSAAVGPVAAAPVGTWSITTGDGTATVVSSPGAPPAPTVVSVGDGTATVT